MHLDVIGTPAPGMKFVLMVRFEGNRSAFVLLDNFFDAERRFFFYYGVMVTKKRLLVAPHDGRKLLGCELHEIFGSVFNVEDLSQETLLRSSRQPFVKSELNASSLFTTFH